MEFNRCYSRWSLALIILLLLPFVSADLYIKEADLDIDISGSDINLNDVKIKYDKDMNFIRKQLKNNKANKEWELKELYHNNENKNQIYYEWDNKPSNIQKISYGKHYSIIDCGNDTSCYMDRKDKFFYILCWEKENFCINTFSELEDYKYNLGRAGTVLDIRITDNGYYKQINPESSYIKIKKDLFYSSSVIEFSNNVSKYDFVDFIYNNTQCTTYNFSVTLNTSTIPLICQLEFKNNSIINFSTEQTSPDGQRGLTLAFQADAMAQSLKEQGMILVGSDVKGYFGRVTFIYDRTWWQSLLFTNRSSGSSTFLEFDNSVFINQGYPETGGTLFESQANVFENASFNDCYWSYASPTGVTTGNIKLIGSSNVIENTINFPTNIDVSDLDTLKVRATAEGASACFTASFFGIFYSRFSDAFLQCQRISTGIFSGVYLNITDTEVDFLADDKRFCSGFNAAASLNFFYTLFYQFYDYYNQSAIKINVSCQSKNSTYIRPALVNPAPSGAAGLTNLSYKSYGINMSQPTLSKYWYGGSAAGTIIEETNYTTICNFTDPTGTYFPIYNRVMDAKTTRSGELYFFPRKFEHIIIEEGGSIIFEEIT